MAYPQPATFIIPDNMDFCQQYSLLYTEEYRNTRMRQLMLILLQKLLFKSLLIENNGLRFPSFREKWMSWNQLIGEIIFSPYIYPIYILKYKVYFIYTVFLISFLISYRNLLK